MNVIIINSLYYPYRFGGAEISVQLLAEELVSSGNNVKIITLNDKGEISRSEINGVHIVSIPLKNFYWPFSGLSISPFKRVAWHLKDLFNREMVNAIKPEIINFCPDVIHTNNLAGFSVGVWNLIAKLKIPLVHTARDYYLFHPNSTLFKNGKNMPTNKLFVRIYSSYKKRFSQNVDVMIGISFYISNIHKTHGFSSRALHQYIYNPVEVIEKINNYNDKIKVGFLGRLTSEKGFDIFIDYAKKYGSKMSFVAAGKTDSTEESIDLLEKAKKNNVDIRGFVPVEKFLSEIDALLLPTKWNEPFGRVVAEAGLAKVPVFTNLTGGVKEIATMIPWIQSLDSFSIDSITEQQNKIKSHENFQNPFDKRAMADKYLDAYFCAVEKNKSK